MAPSVLEDLELIGAAALATAATVAAPFAFPAFVAEVEAGAAALSSAEALETLSAADAAALTATATASEPFFYAGAAAPGLSLTALRASTMSTQNKSSQSGTDAKDNGVSSSGTKDYTPDLLGTQGIRYHDPAVPVRSVIQPKSLLALPYSFWHGELKVKGNETVSFTAFTMDSAEQMLTLIKPYRYAHLAHAEVCVMPTQRATLANMQVDACWTTSDTPDLSYNQQLGRISHTRAVWIPNVATPSNFIVPAPLHNLNPVIKDSIRYNDTPKAHIALWATGLNNIPDDTIVAHVVIRGTVWVSSPSLY